MMLLFLISVIFCCWPPPDVVGHQMANNSVVSGVCSRPNLPPKARIRFASQEKMKFAENETVYILCEENMFPHHIQKRRCHHGSWIGPRARCGRALQTKVTRLEVSSCQSAKKLLSVNLEQSDETPYPLPTNSFHFSRVNETIDLAVNDSNCYRWHIHFEKPHEISFLLIDVNLLKLNATNVTKPVMNVNVKNRNCTLEYTSYQLMEQDEIYGNYFFCNLFENLTLLPATSPELQTDQLEMIINTGPIPRTVGLEGVFVGETYKKQLKHLGNKTVPDCGKMEIVRTGVLEQVELGHVLLSCNDSFIDINNGGRSNSTRSGSNTKYKFVCDANGEWQGDFPWCLPRQTCPKEEIIKDLDSSAIQIEEIGNVYYVNETEWFAIDHSWVVYTCTHFESIMVGKSERTCLQGKWTNKRPHCTQALNSGTKTITIIIGILLVLIGVFSMIVYLSIRAHSKKIHRKLESTKSEIEERALNKQMSASDYYTDIGLDTIYEDCKEIYTVPEYETADDVRYDLEPSNARFPSYRNQFSNDSSSTATTGGLHEPEYLVMTEGTLSRKNYDHRQQPEPEDQYEYSLL